jgi:hypothetical protein
MLHPAHERTAHHRDDYDHQLKPAARDRARRTGGLRPDPKPSIPMRLPELVEGRRTARTFDKLKEAPEAQSRCQA